MPVRCIAFDLDDTFWDCGSVITNAEAKLYQWLAQHFPVITTRYTSKQLIQQRHTFFDHHPELQHDLGLLRIQWLEALLLSLIHISSPRD